MDPRPRRDAHIRRILVHLHYGEAWISSSWLSQVAATRLVYGGDWAGPVILSSLAIGATVAIFLHLLSPHFDPARAILIAALALLLSTTHFLARPHVLALPVLLAFIGGLIAAADRRTSSIMVAAAVDDAVGQSAWRLRARPGADRADRT